MHRRPPFYYEPLSDGEISMDPAKAGGWLVDDIAATAEGFREWILEDNGLAVDLAVIAHEREKRAVIAWRTALGEGTLTASTDPSGWVKLTAALGDEPVFTAYLDRPWEQYEFWPVGARPTTEEEAPGRMGKKRHWVCLSAVTWPALRPIANPQGWVNIEVDEPRLGLRMDEEGR